jgi:tRNA-Thr(GGU) m(6)t(6)A37 methyltransferase TsaA
MRSIKAAELTLRPIGLAKTPFAEKAQAPRQPRAAGGARGTIELFPGFGYEDALFNLETWSHLWLLFWFDRTGVGWKPKVMPPRSTKKRGVFATRSPHRPNPIGLSLVRLERVEGLVLHVRDVDLLDETPILDIKPYVPYTDAKAGARGGWLAEDPEAPWTVTYAPEAEARLEWLAAKDVPLRAEIDKVLALGPQPHAYRRIRKDTRAGADGVLVLAVKEWRVRFRVSGARDLCVLDVLSGYRASELWTSDAPAVYLHQRFVEAFEPSCLFG